MIEIDVLKLRSGMKNIIYIHVVICGMIAMFLFAGCDKSEDVPPQPEEKVTLLISLPKEALGTRSIGDPGTPVDEGADWDQLAVILAYTDASNIPSSYNPKVLVKTISKTDFENLPSVSGNENVKLLSVDAWAGTVHIYGVTYSEDEAKKVNLYEAIKACSSDADVKALKISNDYASGSTSKFVSVATGFYKDDNGTLDEFEIQEGGNGTVGSIPRMSLKRLAAKIDIQWDAADAYPNYTDVKVTGFTFDGGASVTDHPSGFGRLFPELNASSTVLIGNKTFVNRSEISQRNGRVYHYVFPDGVSTPKVTFNISANESTVPKGYNLKFSGKLSPATWYKVNATIKGVTGDGSIDVFNVNDSGQ